MTEVAFHLNVGDRTAYLCRLLRKAYLKGSRVHVLGEASSLEALDRALWLMAPGEFVPHARSGSAAHVRRHSPIVLGALEPEWAQVDVLVNLADQALCGVGVVPRIIEVVGSEPGGREKGRERWRLYRQAGIEPTAHDLSASVA
ncbi:DNA polymerase III subunit chi [Hydrogenophaga pseudoflava]|uniref:DNA polymerase III subunit chi n=1 Tax=Hydrogenophaga pseudoflava TaxID=47421 RepID=UPI0027E4BD22|nr:DNA polymerase III subunit chi [Hydrogenophaga pseudoflava]MDQ7744440.1 DNA polymerase III subunit chi [Hydrogenophaga pseudoflava]